MTQPEPPHGCEDGIPILAPNTADGRLTFPPSPASAGPEQSGTGLSSNRPVGTAVRALRTPQSSRFDMESDPSAIFRDKRTPAARRTIHRHFRGRNW